jgi:precorrin-6B methylase 2
MLSGLEEFRKVQNILNVLDELLEKEYELYKHKSQLHKLFKETNSSQLYEDLKNCDNEIEFTMKRFEQYKKLLFCEIDKMSRIFGLRRTIIELEQIFDKQKFKSYMSENILEDAISHLLCIDDRYEYERNNSLEKILNKGASWYADTPYKVTKYLMRILNEIGINFKNSTFYDIGSGFGAMVFYLAIMYDFKKIVGIEIAPWRVEYCNNVKSRLGLNNVEFLCKDARDAEYSEGDLFYLFNPFPNEKVLKGVAKKLEKCKGKIIASIGACNNYFNNQEWLDLIKEIFIPQLVSYCGIYEII